MRTCRFFLGMAIAGLFVQNSTYGQAPTADALNHGLLVDVDEVNDIATFSWWGVSGETYFMQVTPDLTTGWEYVDHIYSGSDDELGHSFAANADKFFFRLRFTDQHTSDPQNDDFDSDGIGNLAELNQDTDPFNWADFNSDQIPDDWETYYDGAFSVYSQPLVETLLMVGNHTRTLYLDNDTLGNVNFTGTLVPESYIPDNYLWTDSLTGSASYVWNDISGTGTLLETISDADEKSEKIVLTQMTFTLYDNDYSEIWVSSKGYINFLNELNEDSNGALPYDLGNDFSGIGGEGMIAPFWDDLNPSYSGEVYYQEFSDRVVIQYDNVEDSRRTGYFTFQVILYASGEIDFIYNQLTGEADRCTVGLQDIDFSRATQVARNETYLQSNMAIRFSLAYRSPTPTGLSYGSKDSLSGQVTHTWTDISTSGTLLTNVSSVVDGSEKITLSQFLFPHYGVDYSEVWVASNGYLNLLSQLDEYVNSDLPNTSAPQGIIAAFWEDLDPSVTGNIYYLESPDHLIVQYDSVSDYDQTGIFTFQIVLHASGKIEFIYEQMGGLLTSATVGTQNVSRDTAKVVAYNEVYLQSNMTVVLEAATLFSLSPESGSVASSSILPMVLSINAIVGIPGRHVGNVEVVHDALAAQSPFLVPYDVLLYTDSNGDGIADEWISDSDSDGLIDGWEYEAYGYLGVNHRKDSDGDGVLDFRDAGLLDGSLGAISPVILLPADGGVY